MTRKDAFVRFFCFFFSFSFRIPLKKIFPLTRALDGEKCFVHRARWKTGLQSYYEAIFGNCVATVTCNLKLSGKQGRYGFDARPTKQGRGGGVATLATINEMYSFASNIIAE